jgi:hypothetical protein
MCVIVGRLTRSLPLSRPDGPPVYVARVPAAPFCETPWRLAQTPYKVTQYLQLLILLIRTYSRHSRANINFRG